MGGVQDIQTGVWAGKGLKPLLERCAWCWTLCLLRDQHFLRGSPFIFPTFLALFTRKLCNFFKMQFPFKLLLLCFVNTANSRIKAQLFAFQMRRKPSRSPVQPTVPVNAEVPPVAADFKQLPFCGFVQKLCRQIPPLVVRVAFQFCSGKFKMNSSGGYQFCFCN